MSFVLANHYCLAQVHKRFATLGASHSEFRKGPPKRPPSGSGCHWIKLDFNGRKIEQCSLILNEFRMRLDVTGRPGNWAVGDYDCSAHPYADKTQVKLSTSSAGFFQLTTERARIPTFRPSDRFPFVLGG
jgi:hypothetical protein